jgi:hypothetical protein
VAGSAARERVPIGSPRGGHASPRRDLLRPAEDYRRNARLRSTDTRPQLARSRSLGPWAPVGATNVTAELHQLPADPSHALELARSRARRLRLRPRNRLERPVHPPRGQQSRGARPLRALRVPPPARADRRAPARLAGQTNPSGNERRCRVGPRVPVLPRCAVLQIPPVCRPFLRAATIASSSSGIIPPDLVPICLN